MKKISIVLVLLFTLAIGTKAYATLTLGTTSVSSNGPLTLSTSSSTLVLPTTNGTNGQVLTTNGAGTTSWSTVGGGGGITNSAGANVIPKSDGVNLVGSRISDDGTNIVIAESVANLIKLFDEDGGSIYIGDGNSVGNGSVLYVNDSNKQTRMIAGTEYLAIDGVAHTINLNAAIAINLDSTDGTVSIGDVSRNYQTNSIFLSDSANQIALGRDAINDPTEVGGIFINTTLGTPVIRLQGGAAGNGTEIIYNDADRTISLTSYGQTTISAGGVRIITPGTKPSCDADHRGTWFTSIPGTEGQFGDPDKTEQCMLSSFGTYVWISVVTAP